MSAAIYAAVHCARPKTLAREQWFLPPNNARTDEFNRNVHIEKNVKHSTYTYIYFNYFNSKSRNRFALPEMKRARAQTWIQLIKSIWMLTLIATLLKWCATSNPHAIRKTDGLCNAACVPFIYLRTKAHLSAIIHYFASSKLDECNRCGDGWPKQRSILWT